VCTDDVLFSVDEWSCRSSWNGFRVRDATVRARIINDAPAVKIEPVTSANTDQSTVFK